MIMNKKDIGKTLSTYKIISCFQKPSQNVIIITIIIRVESYLFLSNVYPSPLYLSNAIY